MRLLVVVVCLASACASPSAVECPGAVTCPAGNVCDPNPAHDPCVDPSQLHSCEGTADGSPCAIAAPGDGICDANVCIHEGCGDGYIRGGEQCDGASIPDDANCTDLNFYVSARPTCTADCTFDTASCSERCGDGTLQPAFEICETGSPVTASCVDFGFGAGALGCINCGPETSACIPFGWSVTDIGGGGFALHGTSASDVYASVGASPPVAHFDGTTWTPVDVSACGFAVAGGIIEHVFTPSAGVVFLVRGDEVARLSGTACTKLTLPNVVTDIWAASATDAWATVQGNGAGVYHFDGTAWTLSLSSTGFQVPVRVWGSSTTDVYAIKASGAMSRWNGTSWSAFSPAGLPAPSDVWGTGPADIYVGGSDATGHAKIVHHDGSTWTPVLDALPLLAGATTSRVYRGQTAGDHQIVVAETTTPTRTFVLYSDGHGWVDLDAPAPNYGVVWASPSGPVFSTVVNASKIATLERATRVDYQAAFSSLSIRALVGAGIDDMWSTTGDGLFHWDGAQWQSDPLGFQYDVDVAPSGMAFALLSGSLNRRARGATAWTADTDVGGEHVFALGDTNVWIIQGHLLVHWTGSGLTATQQTIDAPNDAYMHALWGTSSTDLYLVGGDGGDPAVVMHFDGTTFTSIPVPNGVGALTRITGTSDSDIFAVSSAQQLIHFDGTAWTQVDVPGQANDVYGTASDLFVGTPNGLLHFDGTAWSPVAVGVPTGVIAVTGLGRTLLFVDYFGRWHELVRLSAW